MSENLKYFIMILMEISALCVALPIHEWAHAFVAYKQGDPTAKVMGRMTPAAFAHFDIFGFVCLYIFGFGWAKPVPVDYRNFKNQKKSGFLVAIAGITANLLMGIIFIAIYSALNTFVPNYVANWGAYGLALNYFLIFSVQINFMLFFFNILPIYPLDGFRVVETFSKPGNKTVEMLKRYSFIILLIFIIVIHYYDFYFSNTAYRVMNGLETLFNKFFALFVRWWDGRK